MENFQKLNFSSKGEAYTNINKIMQGMIKDEPDWLANLANSAALLGMMLNDINWVGYYLYKNDELVLGPFYGKPACTHIAMGDGVCGTAAAERQTQIVKNVHEFPGHIACDSASMSELVIPLISPSGQLYGVLDIDSPSEARFDEGDAEGMELVVKTLLKYIDWDVIK